MANQLLLQVKALKDIPDTDYEVGAIHYVKVDMPFMGYKLHIWREKGYYGDYVRRSTVSFNNLEDFLKNFEVLSVEENL